MPLSEVEAVLRALREGRAVVVGDEDRGGTGDAVASAALVTPATSAWIADRAGAPASGPTTDAVGDLLALAGLAPEVVSAGIATTDAIVAGLPQLLALGERDGVPVTTVAAVRRHVDERRTGGGEVRTGEPAPGARVRFEVETDLRTEHGVFRARAYRDLLTGAEHVALLADGPAPVPVVRVHSECLTGEVFGSLQCECGPQLAAALTVVHREGGAVVYLRGQEGRGIGLVDKLRAYRLQEEGLDTLDANLALGLPADAREYGAAAAILTDLGLTGVRLLTNNPDKIAQLQEHGVEVAERVPLVVGVVPANERYLATKRDRMGHLIDGPRAVPSAAEGRRAG